VANASLADQLQLLDLQQLDTKLTQLAHQRKVLPELEQVAAAEGKIADLSSALLASRTAASDLKRELTKAEADVEQVTTRLERDQARLDSGSVSAKDATALLDEVSKLTVRRGSLEEVQLDFMERYEAHSDALSKLEAANAGMEEDLIKAKEALAAADAAVVTEGKAVVVERDYLAGKIPADLVALYNKVRAQNGGLGAVPLIANRCGGCRLELNPTDLASVLSAPEDKIVRCEECSRILVRVPEKQSDLAKAF